MGLRAFLGGYVVTLCASAVAVAAPILNTPYVLVSDYQFGRIQRFTPQGQFIDTFASIGSSAGEMAFGPDGHLYISSFTHNRIVKVNGQTGAFISNFITGGSLHDPRGIAFGSDGHLYVSAASDGQDFQNGAIQKYHGVTGAFLGDFASGANLNHPTGLTFGPDGDVYVALDTRYYNTTRADAIRRFDSATGAFEGVVATSGVNIPQHVLFGPDGKMWVTNQGSASITRYLNGNLVDTITGLGNAQGIAFLPDGTFLAGTGSTAIPRRDIATGAFINWFTLTDVNFAADILYVPEPASAAAVAAILLGSVGLTRPRRRRCRRRGRGRDEDEPRS